MFGLDLETTGVDVETDRIVTASLIVVRPGGEPVTYSWLADPGIPIPDGASAVHGVTTERARAHGRPVTQVIEEIAEKLAGLWREDVPLVGYNASYDLSLLDREMGRHFGANLEMLGPVVDPLVADRALDRYRKGGRKLGAVCQHYGVTLMDAHTSDADTLATLQLAWKLAKRYQRDFGLVDLAALQEDQRRWHRVWALGLAAWLRGEAGKLGAAWELKSEAGRALVGQKLAKLDISGTPDDGIVAAAVAETLRRAEDVAGSAEHWPIRPRP
jgi:DNA polymerase-3 subunit epsilon